MVTYIVKLIPSLFDIATVYLIFDFVRSRKNVRVALLVAAVYAFNPATIFNSSIWGQFDSIYTFFLLLSFRFLLSSKLPLTVSTFTLAALTKPQSLALALFMVYLIYKKFGLNGIYTSLLIIASTTLLIILPLKWDNPLNFLVGIYLTGYSMFNYTSVNAFNFWGLFGLWKPDTQGVLFFTPYLIGWIMYAVLTFISLYLVNERLDSSDETIIYLNAFILLFGFFMLPTRIHERYSYSSISFLALLTPFLKKTRVIYLIVTTTLLINLFYAMTALNTLTPIMEQDPVVFLVSLTNVLVLVYSLNLTWIEMGKKVQLYPHKS